MDKQIRKVQKWLERCLIACRADSWENALAEMECANAEMEMARKELWTIVENQGKNDRVRFRNLLTNTARAGVLALLIIFASAMPLSRLNISSVLPEIGRDNHIVEFINDEEEVLLQALRNSLSENGFRESTFTDQGQSTIIRQADVDPGSEKDERIALSPYGAVTSPAVTDNNSETVKPPEESLTLESLIALVQIGEEALRESEPAIKIQRQR